MSCPVCEETVTILKTMERHIQSTNECMAQLLELHSAVPESQTSRLLPPTPGITHASYCHSTPEGATAPRVELRPRNLSPVERQEDPVSPSAAADGAVDNDRVVIDNQMAGVNAVGGNEMPNRLNTTDQLLYKLLDETNIYDPFKCINCHAQFITDTALEEHFRVHPLICKLCGKDYASRRSLYMHFLDAHLHVNTAMQLMCTPLNPQYSRQQSSSYFNSWIKKQCSSKANLQTLKSIMQ